MSPSWDNKSRSFIIYEACLFAWFCFINLSVELAARASFSLPESAINNMFSYSFAPPVYFIPVNETNVKERSFTDCVSSPTVRTAAIEYNCNHKVIHH